MILRHGPSSREHRIKKTPLHAVVLGSCSRAALESVSKCGARLFHSHASALGFRYLYSPFSVYIRLVSAWKALLPCCRRHFCSGVGYSGSAYETQRTSLDGPTRFHSALERKVSEASSNARFELRSVQSRNISKSCRPGFWTRGVALNPGMSISPQAASRK